MRRFDRRMLRNLRLYNKYTLEMLADQLAGKTGKRISKTAISNWENGKNTPSLESVLALSDIFCVPMDYLFAPKTNYLLGMAITMDLGQKRDE